MNRETMNPLVKEIYELILTEIVLWALDHKDSKKLKRNLKEILETMYIRSTKDD